MHLIKQPPLLIFTDWPHGERPSLVSLARTSGSGSHFNFFQGCVFSGLMHVVSQLEKWFDIFFLRVLPFLAPSNVFLCYCIFSGATASAGFPFVPCDSQAS